MDRYEDFDAYVRAKMRVFNGARKAVISREDKVVGTACSCFGPHLDVVRFGTGVPALGDFGVSVYDEEPWLCRGEASGLQWLLPVREVPLAGAHNVANVLAALALADALEIAIEPALDAIREFRALSHRCEIVSRGASRVWVNDSKGTNVGATAAAVSGLSGEGPVVLIAGGDGKGADFGPLREAVAGRVRAAVLLGRDADRIASEIEPHVPCHFVVTMDEAVETAYAHSLPGDVIALSPACASWDMYPNYQARGEEFAALVRAFVTREDAA